MRGNGLRDGLGGRLKDMVEGIGGDWGSDYVTDWGDS